MSEKGRQEFPERVKKVLGFLDSNECDYRVRVVETPAHHARQAAELLNCPLGAIVKSLVFKVRGGHKFFLVLVSGPNRASQKKLLKIIEEQLFPAKPDEVLMVTGYPVGAVPPFGMNSDISVIIDQDLMAFQNLWASAGSANILVSFQSSILKKITDGQVYDIKEV